MIKRIKPHEVITNVIEEVCEWYKLDYSFIFRKRCKNHHKEAKYIAISLISKYMKVPIGSVSGYITHSQVRKGVIEESLNTRRIQENIKKICFLIENKQPKEWDNYIVLQSKMNVCEQ